MNILISLSSDKIYERLVRDLKSYRSVCLIAPEQYLFETERNMYRELGGRAISGINITGFSKIASDIVGRFEPKLYADDVVKQAAMYKTLTRLSPRLKYYKGFGAAKFARRMLDLAADLKSSGISPSDLRSAVENSDVFFEELMIKTADIAEIYQAYCESLNAEFADKLDDLGKAADLIRENGCFDGTAVFIYEFDGFSKSQINFLKAVSDSAKSLSVFLRTDCEKSEKRELFAMNSLIAKLRREFPDCEITALGGEPNNPETELYAADDVYRECEFIAAKIRELITKGGYACNDIGVLAADPSITPELRNAFAEYGISAFADLPEPILRRPLTRFIITALEAATLETDKILAFVRSGFARIPTAGKPGKTKRISKRNMDLLEKYARKWNLTKREWGRKFPESNADLNSIEPLRALIVEPLVKLKRAADDAPGDLITEAVFEFLVDTMQLQRSVIGFCRLAGAKKADEYRQLWDLIVGVFESLHMSLKDIQMTLSGYAELLREVFSSVNIALPPQGIDAVTVGDPERSRMNRMKAVFISGANLGLFPKSIALTTGEFSGKELETLAENRIEIRGRREERYNFERYVAGKAMTMPSEKLFISAPRKNAAWEETRLSPIFFENGGKKVINTADLPLSFRASTIKSARRLLAETQNPKLKAALIQAGDDTAELIMNPVTYEHKLSPETAKKIMSFETLSPTRLETLALCRFRYFCKYGLSPEIPEFKNDDEPGAMERGNIIHYCLDRALREYKDDYSAFLAASDFELGILAENLIAEYREFKLPRGYAESPRQRHILGSFKTGIVSMLKSIRADFDPNNTGFAPRGFERKVDFPFAGTRILGKIDRIDVLTDGGKAYARIIDYKSGGKELDLPSAYYGLDTQMLLYLYAVSGEFEPAAAFYMPADGGKTKGLREAGTLGDAKTARKNWLAAHIPAGIIISDNGAAEADFARQEARYRAETGANKNMRFFKAEKLTPTAYDRLKEHCSKTISDYIAEVNSGYVSAVPLIRGIPENAEVCDYCEFALCCGNKGQASVTADRKAIESVLV